MGEPPRTGGQALRKIRLASIIGEPPQGGEDTWICRSDLHFTSVNPRARGRHVSTSTVAMQWTGEPPHAGKTLHDVVQDRIEIR